MTATGPTTSAPGQTFTPDALLQRVIETALSDTVIDPVVAMTMLGKIMGYDRRDLEWLMDFFERGNQPLAEYLDYTICYLNREQFARFVQRVENFYSELVALPGMGVHEVWELLIGYHSGDPGETPEQTRAVLLVNAVVLDTLLSYRYFPLETVRNVIVHARYNSDYDDAGPGHEWGLKELDPQLISFVIERLEDTDRIIGLIRNEYLWHPDYLALRIDGSLCDEPQGSEAESLRRSLLAYIERSPTPAEWEANHLAEERRDCRARIEEAFDTNDIDTLRVYHDHKQEFLASGSFTDRVIKSLRLSGQQDIAPVLTGKHFEACRVVDAALQSEASLIRDGNSRVAVRALALSNLDNVDTIVDDIGPVAHVIKNHGFRDWDNISAVRNELKSVSPALRDGVL